jgi:hypothetical protein
MFDLDEQLRRWRQETEATLAFEPDEIDELEDHLKLAMEKATGEGASPEQAWERAVSRLGASPSLALEFAKSKLMPALFHLLKSWLRPILLLLLFVATSMANSNPSWAADVYHNRGGPNFVFWTMAWLSFVIMLILLPDKPTKNAVLFGTGTAFCLVPLLYVIFYHLDSDQIVGVGWNRMGASFGWLPISLSLTGLVLLNVWREKWNNISPEKFSTKAALAGAIIFVLVLAPFVAELVGNLSIRDLYSMPTAAQITFTGDARTHFMQWKMVDVLINCIAIIITWVPLILTLVASVGILFIHWSARLPKAEKPAKKTIYPAAQDLPWIMTLAASGLCWIVTLLLEQNLTRQIHEAEKTVQHVSGSYLGVKYLTLPPSLLLLICGYELTKRLRHAIGVRPFYAWMVATAETVFLLIEWPSGVSLCALGLVLWQIWLIRKQTRFGRCDPSILKFGSQNLVGLGLLLGLISACTSLILVMIGVAMAFDAAYLNPALGAWGNSIKDPRADHFDPSFLLNSTNGHAAHLDFWIFSGLMHLFYCLVLGLGSAIVLSGLEFIRFNSYLYYKVRKADRQRRAVLAVNE